MSTEQVIEKYEELCRFCDTAWQNAIHAEPEQFSCGKGCDMCCELQSVTALEAFYIYRHFINSNNERGRPGPQCPFITNHECSIYAARPIICRTHGMLLFSKDFTPHICQSCPDNFTDRDLEKADKACILDIDRITSNLLRLNVAFCMVIGAQNLAGVRLKLSDIKNGILPEILTADL
jgi:uncharacterized protein